MDRKRRQSGRLKSRESRHAEMELKQPLAQRVAAYALAAGAAGLGMMASVQPVEARIVYTRAHIHFERGALLDLNNDGTNDFLISQFSSLDGSFRDMLNVGGAPGNGLRGYLSRFGRTPYASRLALGAKIGVGQTFYRNRNNAMAVFAENTFSTHQYGQWANGTSGFLGLEFQIDGQAHYGWAEVLINADNPYRGEVKGYAYNTVPNQPILAGDTGSFDDSIGEIPPQPATLGLLALGAPGLDIWRPRKRQLTAE